MIVLHQKCNLGVFSMTFRAFMLALWISLEFLLLLHIGICGFTVLGFPRVYIG